MPDPYANPYPYLTVISISVAHCQIRICSIDSLVWAFTKRASDQEGAFDWDQVTGSLDWG